MDNPKVKILFKYLGKVQNLSWGDFLHSVLFDDWLLAFCRGDITAKDDDYDMADVLLDMLPGYPDSGPTSGRGWSVYEEMFPGRFINMKTLKNEIMQVSFPLGNRLIDLGPLGSPNI